MKPYYDHQGITIYHGDCREVLPTLEAVETCITDPPYGIGFMGKEFDTFKPEHLAVRREADQRRPPRTDVRSVASWGNAADAGNYDRSLSANQTFQTWCMEMFTAIKGAMLPGAMCLAFGSPRTCHRLACGIEDAGFEIRDRIFWVYGSGFPKSLDISKAIDKTAGAERDKVSGGTGPGWQRNIGNTRPWMEEEDHKIDGPIPATDAAKQWDGWGTALKPSYEPILLAMKPLDGTFAENALTHGVAGLHIDGGRVGTEDDLNGGAYSDGKQTDGEWGTIHNRVPDRDYEQPTGRWPANLIHDGSDEVLELFPETKSGSLTAEQQTNGGFKGAKSCYGTAKRGGDGEYDANSGSAARFFYCAKASGSDRGNLPAEELPLFNESVPEFRNTHPTVKPLELMRYLCRLTATPTGGTVLDPFAGSGTTLVAAKLEGRKAIGIEIEEKYCKIAAERLRQGVLL